MALKSLSLPNTGYNIGTEDNILRWIEGYKDGSISLFVAFSVTLTPGYYTASELCTHINDEILAMSNHFFQFETPPTISFSFNAKFRIEISVNSGTDDKLFSPYFTSGSNLWHRLGFDMSQGIDHQANIKLPTQSGDVIDMEDISYGKSIQQYDDLLDNIAALTLDAFEPFRSMRASANTIIVSSSPTTIENFAGLFVSTDLSINSSWETHKLNGRNSVAPTHILEWIPNNVSRYSYLNHEVNMLSYHKLYQDEITDFKLILKDFDGATMNKEQIKEFNMVIIIETETEDQELTDDEQANLWARSWAKNHPTRILQ